MKCNNKLKVIDLIPIISFLIQKGRCRYCKEKISIQYPIIEFITAILFSVFYLKYSEFLSSIFLIQNVEEYFLSYLPLIRDWYFISILIIIFVYDLKYYLILDKITVPTIIIGIIINIILGVSLVNLFIGILIGGGFFLIQFLLSKGAWIGGGDIRLGVLMGVILLWPNILVGLFLSYIIGACVGIYLIVSKKNKLKDKVPLGVFLVIGTIISMYFGEHIINFYLSLL